MLVVTVIKTEMMGKAGIIDPLNQKSVRACGLEQVVCAESTLHIVFLRLSRQTNRRCCFSSVHVRFCCAVVELFGFLYTHICSFRRS